MIELSPDQEMATDLIQQWYRSGADEFRLGGLAGTGKTTIIAQLKGLLGLAYGDGITFVAPTGRAASVLSRKLPADAVATTIHQFMYQPQEVHCENCEGPDSCHGMNSMHCGRPVEAGDDGVAVCRLSFRYAPPEPAPKLVVCDEASMVGTSMYEHLREVGSQLLFVGDHGQLAPIDGGVTLMAEDKLDIRLEHIHRQAKGSPILELAMIARRGEPILPGVYGESPWVECLPGRRIAEGLDLDIDTMLICYTNSMRRHFNRMVRAGLGFAGMHPEVGERVICLRNNHGAGVSNGMIGVVEDCVPSGMFYRLRIRMVDTDREYIGMCSQAQFHEQPDARLIRGVDQWTWGYCLTAHKAQGSEADHVIIVQESKMSIMSNAERRRWLYTAITRAKERLTIYTPIMSRS